MKYHFKYSPSTSHTIQEWVDIFTSHGKTDKVPWLMWLFWKIEHNELIAE